MDTLRVVFFMVYKLTLHRMPLFINNHFNKIRLFEIIISTKLPIESFHNGLIGFTTG